MKGGGRAPPTPPAWAYFTLMMECTPESSRCYSVYSVVPANEHSCAHNVTWSPYKFWRSTSIFSLCCRGMELERAHCLTFLYQPVERLYCKRSIQCLESNYRGLYRYLKHICKGIPRHSQLHFENPAAQLLLCAKYLPIIPHIFS